MVCCSVVAVNFGAWHGTLDSVGRNISQICLLLSPCGIEILATDNKLSILRNIQIAIKLPYLLITLVIYGGALVMRYLFGN